MHAAAFVALASVRFPGHAPLVSPRHALPCCTFQKIVLRKISDRVFSETVKDGGTGGANPTECYAMVLKTYLYLNRWASVEPPSRALIEQTVSDADLDGNGLLDRGEFRRLVGVCAARAVWRILATLCVNAIVGPLLALVIASQLARQRWWMAVVASLARLLPQKFGQTLVGSPIILRTSLTFLFAYTLGDAILRAAHRSIDHINVRPYETDSESYRRMRRMQRVHRSRVRRLLRRVPEFATLSRRQLADLQNAMRVTRIPRGDYVFRQGDEGESFYVILSGSVDVVRTEDAPMHGTAGRGPVSVVLARMGEGACFGERALLKCEARYASVIATSPLVVLRISRSEFEAHVGALEGLSPQEY